MRHEKVFLSASERIYFLLCKYINSKTAAKIRYTARVSLIVRQWVRVKKCMACELKSLSLETMGKIPCR